ncbi:MAG: hypothetical protein MHM6MM_001157 [Cercozoa sp. M6MM]
MEDTVVLLENVKKTYLLGTEGVAAVRGVDLQVKRGEFVVILGKSGSGKTSVLNICGLIDTASKGDVTICGQRVSRASVGHDDQGSDEELARLRLAHVGFVFQSFNLMGSLNVTENVMLPLTLAGELSRTQARERARDLLDQVGLSHRVEAMPSTLSGGEQQRVAIARALSNNPELLLLDEPTGDLDSASSDRVMSLLLEQQRKRGIALLMVTHDVSLSGLADRVVHMVDGKVARVTPVAAVIRDEAVANLHRRIDEARNTSSDASDVVREQRDPLQHQRSIFARHLRMQREQQQEEERHQRRVQRALRRRSSSGSVPGPII